MKKLVGYCLLAPALFSVGAFFMQLFAKVDLLENFNNKAWTQAGGNKYEYRKAKDGRDFVIITKPDGKKQLSYDIQTAKANEAKQAASSAGGGFTSSLPIYFGLMAIAGAYLIKDDKKYNNKDSDDLTRQKCNCGLQF
jgi:hypothetical protein